MAVLSMKEETQDSLVMNSCQDILLFKIVPRRVLNFGLLGPLTGKLAALERLKKNCHRLIMGKMMSPLFLCCS